MNQLFIKSVPILLSLTAYNALFTGIFIFVKRSDRSGFHYLIFNLTVFGWALGLSFIAPSAASLADAESWGRFSQACFFLIPVAWFHFVLSYTGRIRGHVMDLVLVYLFSAGLLYFVYSPVFILTFREAPGFRFFPVPGPAFKALTTAFAVISIHAFWVLLRFWRREHQLLKKEDARFFFFTQLAGYLLISLAVLPAYGLRFSQYQLFCLPLWQLLLAYAMIRHHLLDDEALARTLRRDRLAAMATVTMSMHHELKNPLTAIKTFAEYLPKKYEDENFRNKFSRIVIQEIRRVEDLLRQLLDFSRPREPQLAPVEIREVLEETLDFLGHSLEEKGIQLDRRLAGEGTVMADRNQMKQVFLNILLNSVQAMPEGGVIRVETRRRKQDEIEIVFTDTGHGISKEQLRQVKEPFFTTKEKGSGLGLSIVQQILDRHEAAMEIESAPGRGTSTFIRMKCLTDVSSGSGHSEQPSESGKIQRA